MSLTRIIPSNFKASAPSAVVLPQKTSLKKWYHVHRLRISADSRSPQASQAESRTTTAFNKSLGNGTNVRQQNLTGARSMPTAIEPASTDPAFWDWRQPFGLGPSPALDKWLNLGVLGTAAAAFLALVVHSGPNPWATYQEAVTANPIETKACISGVVYSLGDLIAQTYEGRDVSEWDRGRVLRSGLCGLLAHGPLSHLYYVALDHAFAQQIQIPPDSWLVPLVKVGVDQTAWSLFWNSTYYVLLGCLKLESPAVIAATVKGTWWDLLKAGWRLWPLVHLFTYGVIPVQHRLLFVDSVELVWVSILSMYGQQQRREREETGAGPGWVACALPGGDGEGGDAAEEILRGMQLENKIIFEPNGGERLVLTAEEVYEAEASLGLTQTAQEE